MKLKGLNLEFGQVKQTFAFCCVPKSQGGRVGVAVLVTAYDKAEWDFIKIMQQPVKRLKNLLSFTVEACC